MNKHWYSVELDRDKADEFKSYLRKNNIKFEPSEAFNLIHIQCYMSFEEQFLANKFLYNLHLT